MDAAFLNPRTSLLSQVLYGLLLFSFYLAHLFIKCDAVNYIIDLKKNTTKIDPYANITDNENQSSKYVYFYVENITYPTYFDSFFNFESFGGCLTRKVEYCQYKEINETSESSYSKIWSSQLINSTNFVNQKYQNPEIPEVLENFEPYVRYNNVTIGNYVLNQSLFDNIKPLYYMEPMNEHREKFRESNASKIFQYLRFGWFYYSFHNDTRFRLDYIKQDISIEQEELSTTEYQRKVLNKFFKMCYPGDIRVRFELFAPRNVTVFALRINDTLVNIPNANIRNVNHIKPLHRKYASLDDVLNVIQPDNSVDETIVTFNSFIGVPTLIILIIQLSAYYFGDSKGSAWFIVLIGCFNLTLKSFFYNYWYLNKIFWYTVLLVWIILGIYWKILTPPT